MPAAAFERDRRSLGFIRGDLVLHMQTAVTYAYDMSHLISRLRAQTATGIDRIDLAYSRHLLDRTPDHAFGLHHSRRGPHIMTADMAREYVRAAEQVWTTERCGSILPSLARWIDRDPGEPLKKPVFLAPSRLDRAAWGRRILSWKGRFAKSVLATIPKNAVYINVSYYRLENKRVFDWLGARPDIRAVYMIHDLIPLDYPEFFANGETERFRKILATVFRHGSAFIVSSEEVKKRLAAELQAQGLPPRPIIALRVPSPIAEFAAEPALTTKRPYFVTIGTIEPRKNHLLLLHLWRRLAERLADPPRLVLVGLRGWENEQIVDLLERSNNVRAHVIEVNNVNSRDLAALIRGARALLAPSFIEGYGLPIVEALSVGTPVITSNNAVARETSQGLARFISPHNGDAWEEEIVRHTEDADFIDDRRRASAEFVRPSWSQYFTQLDSFLRNL